MNSKTPDPASVIFGRNPVLELLRNRRFSVDKVLIQDGARGSAIAEVRQLAADAAVSSRYVPRQRLDRVCGHSRHQGVAAITSAVAYTDFRQLVSTITPRVADDRPMLLYLDRITDTGNFGAIIRTALALGVRAILVPSADSAPLNGAVVKASAGAALRVDVARVQNPVEVLEELRERGFWVRCAASNEGVSATEEDWSKPTVLVVGREDVGVHADIRRVCDTLVHIPIGDHIESLNVSVATALLLYEAARSRNVAQAGPSESVANPSALD